MSCISVFKQINVHFRNYLFSCDENIFIGGVSHVILSTPHTVKRNMLLLIISLVKIKK